MPKGIASSRIIIAVNAGVIHCRISDTGLRP
jgi:hypothetical protein